jgi:hypothetical protein
MATGICGGGGWSRGWDRVGDKTLRGGGAEDSEVSDVFLWNSRWLRIRLVGNQLKSLIRFHGLPNGVDSRIQLNSAQFGETKQALRFSHSSNFIIASLLISFWLVVDDTCVKFFGLIFVKCILN